MLLYAAAGVAFGEFGSNLQLFGTDQTLALFYAADQRTSTRAGWTLGGGVEYAVNPHWSVRGEYRYADFGRLGEFPGRDVAGRLLRRRSPSGSEPGAGGLELQVR